MYIQTGGEIQPTSASPENAPLVIHGRGESGEGDSIAIFVHGLFGHRYGSWDRFPDLLLDDVPNMDIGLYAYRNGVRRIRRRRSLTVDDDALLLADILRDLPEHYEKVILLAHSLGGVLAMNALRLNHLRSADEIQALFLFAVPQLGSNRVPRHLRLISKDARALEPGSAISNQVVKFFVDQVWTEDSLEVPPGRVQIPTYSIESLNDSLVSSLSSGLVVSNKQRKRVKLGHRGVCKAQTGSEGFYLWVLERLRSRLTSGPPQSASERNPGSTPAEAEQARVEKNEQIRFTGRQRFRAETMTFGGSHSHKTRPDDE